MLSRKIGFIVLYLMAVLLCGCSRPWSIGTPKIIYVMENDEYVPYYLISEDYDGKYLLLRVETLSEREAFNNTNVYGSAGGYYADSNLDIFLSNEFAERFSGDFLAVVGDAAIQIATYDTVYYSKMPTEIELINRKFFVLSAKEVGIKSNMCASEGEELAKITRIEKQEPQWLRSAYLADDIQAWVWGEGHYGGEAVALMQAVRPAFTLEKSVRFELRDDVIEGQSVKVVVTE